MRFTYHDIEEDILKKYNKKKIRSLNEKEKTSLVNTFYRFLESRKPEPDEIYLKNISDFLTVELAWIYFHKLAKLLITSDSFKYFTNLHIKLREIPKYNDTYQKVIQLEREGKLVWKK